MYRGEDGANSAHLGAVERVNLSVEVSMPPDLPDAPTVVLVHGYPDTSAVWRDVREQLAKDHVVVTYDCRGAGQSSHPQGSRHYVLARFVDDLVAVTDLVSPSAVPSGWARLGAPFTVGSR